MLKNKQLISLIFLLVFYSTSIVYAQKDVMGGRDIPFLPRIEGYYLDMYFSNDYDEFQFWDGEKYVVAGGQMRINHYYIKDDEEPKSIDDIIAYYDKLLNNIKAEKLFYGNFPNVLNEPNSLYKAAIYKRRAKNSELWIQVFVSNNGLEYELIVIEAIKTYSRVTASQIWYELQVNRKFDLYFDFEKFSEEIPKKNKDLVQELLTVLKNKQDINIEIRAYVDEDFKNSEAMRISGLRANSLIDMLLEAGIERNRLSIKIMGRTKSIAPVNTSEGRKINRRIVIKRTN